MVASGRVQSPLRRLHRLHDHMVGPDSQQTLHGQAALYLQQSLVQQICGPDHVFCTEASHMGQECIGAFVNPLVAPEVRHATSLVQGQAHLPLLHADAVFTVVQDGYSIAGLRQIGVFMIGHFKSGLLDGGIPVGGSADAAELHLMACIVRMNGGVEGRLQETVFLLPVHFGLKDHLRVVSVKDHILLQNGLFAETVTASDPILHGAVRHYLPGQKLGAVPKLALKVGVHVPVVPAQRYLLPHEQGVQPAALSPKLPAVPLVDKGFHIALLIEHYSGHRGLQHITLHMEYGFAFYVPGSLLRLFLRQLQHCAAESRNSDALNRQSAAAVHVLHHLLPIAALHIPAVKGNIQYVAAVKGQRVHQSDEPPAARCAAAAFLRLCRQQPGGHFPGLLYDMGHCLDGLVMGAGYAGSRQYVMELIHQKLASQGIDLFPGRRLISLYGSPHRHILQIPEGKLRLSVVPLDHMLISQGSSVQLQIQLSAVDGGLHKTLLQLLHKPAHRGVGGSGHSLQILQPLRHLDHAEFRASAPVPEAVGNQPHPGDRPLLYGVGALLQQVLLQGRRIRPHMGAVEMHQNLRAVDPLPVKGIVGKYIGVVPGHLRGQEILYAAALHNLRQGGAVAEGVRQPECIRCVIKVLSCEPLAPDELAHHVLAGGDVAVALDPHAAVGLVPPLRHSLLDVLEESRIHSLYDIAVVCGALDEGIVRVLIHQVHLVGISPGTFFLRLPPVPQPCRIHVGMADEPCIGGRGGILLLQHILQYSVRPPDLLPEDLRILILYIIGNKAVDLQQRLHEIRPPEAFVLQHTHHLVSHPQVEVELCQFLVLQTDIHRVIDDLIELLSLHQKRLGALDIMIRIVFQRYIDGLSRSGPLPEHVAVMIPVAVFDELGGKIAVGLSVHPEHSLVAPDPGIDKQSLPLQRLRNPIPAPEPAVDPLSLKNRPVRTLRKALLLRHAVVAPIGEERLHVHSVLHCEQLRLQHLLIAPQFLQHSFQLRLRIHRPCPPFILRYSLYLHPPHIAPLRLYDLLLFTALRLSGFLRPGSALDLQIPQKLGHVILIQYAQIGVVEPAVVMHQIMAEAPHLLHHDAALGQNRIPALRIVDHI